MPPKKGGRKTKKKGSKHGNATPPAVAASNEEEQHASLGDRILASAIQSDPEKCMHLFNEAHKLNPTKSDDEIWEMMARQMEELQHEEDLANMSKSDRKAAKKEIKKAKSGYMEEKETKRCDYLECTKVGVTNVCSKCKCSVYCGRDCQLAHWPLHKKQCKSLKICKESIPRLPAQFAKDKIPWHVGIARTENHWTHVYVMDRLSFQDDRCVPLSSVCVQNESPTLEDLIKCLVLAMMNPEFDTTAAGPRRPYEIVVEGESFDSLEMAQRFAAVCCRLRILVVDIQGRHYEKNKNWFFVQDWRDEISDAEFQDLQPIEPNGNARLELAEVIREQNKVAAAQANLDQSFPTREQVMSLPFEEGRFLDLSNAMGVAVYEGVLYINSREGHLFYHAPVVLDTISRRPSIQDVLGPIYKVIVERGQRPLAVFLGQPSIGSHQDVEQYERALDGTILRDHCSLAMMGMLENNLKQFYIPHWKSVGII